RQVGQLTVLGSGMASVRVAFGQVRSSWSFTKLDWPAQAEFPASELDLDRGNDVLPGALPPRPRAPFLERDATRFQPILLEDLDLAACERLIVDVEIRLVVEAEGAWIEVRRPDRHHPVVH